MFEIIPLSIWCKQFGKGQNQNNPSCVDLFVNNSYRNFQNTSTISKGLSDFQKMYITVLKTKFEKTKPKEITYWDYKKFDESNFKFELKSSLTKGCATYGEFEDIFLKVLQKHAPLKKKLIRANHAPYMKKGLEEIYDEKIWTWNKVLLI